MRNADGMGGSAAHGGYLGRQLSLREEGLDELLPAREALCSLLHIRVAHEALRQAQVVRIHRAAQLSMLRCRQDNRQSALHRYGSKQQR